MPWYSGSMRNYNWRALQEFVRSRVRTCSRACRFTVFAVVLVFLLVYGFCHSPLQPDILLTKRLTHSRRVMKPQSYSPGTVPVVMLNLSNGQTESSVTTKNCNLYNEQCFSLRKCGFSFYSDMKIYIHAPAQYVVDQSGAAVLAFSDDEQHMKLLETVRASSYYTQNKEVACFFMPPFSLLNANRHSNSTTNVLESLETWNPDGKNHLVFSFVSGISDIRRLQYESNFNQPLTFQTHAALVVSAHFVEQTYRHNFDVAIPMLNPFISDLHPTPFRSRNRRKWLLAAHLSYYSAAHRRFVKKMFNDKAFVMFEWCDKKNDTAFRSADYVCRAATGNNSSFSSSAPNFSYPDALADAEFCLILPGTAYSPMFLREALSVGCVPIVAFDDFIMPFEDVLDWKRAALFVQQAMLQQMLSASALQRFLSPEGLGNVDCWRQQGIWLYDHYFRNISVIVNTVFKVLEHRLYPHKHLPYNVWNGGG